MKLPDFDRLLPSFAWEDLVEFLVQRLEEAPMGPGLNPVYDYVRACEDTKSSESEWVRQHLFDALTEAKNRYEDRHPPGWDNEKQQGYREGIKSRW